MFRSEYILNRSTYVDPISDHKQSRLLKGDYQFAHVDSTPHRGKSSTNYSMAPNFSIGSLPRVQSWEVKWPSSNSGARRNWNGDGELWSARPFDFKGVKNTEAASRSRRGSKGEEDGTAAAPKPTAPYDDTPFQPTVPALPRGLRPSLALEAGDPRRPALRRGRVIADRSLPAGPHVTIMDRRTRSTRMDPTFIPDLGDSPGVRRSREEIMDANNPLRKGRHIVDTTGWLDNDPSRTNIRNPLTDTQVEQEVPERRRSVVPRGPDPRRPAEKGGLGNYGRNRFQGIIEGADIGDASPVVGRPRERGATPIVRNKANRKK